jgi:hypothetical protein
VLTAEIASSGDGAPRLARGVLAGRAEVSSLLSVIGNLFAEEQLLCARPDIFGLAKASICASPDLPANRTNDGKGLPCDAVSFAMGFEAAPAWLGRHSAPKTAQECPTELRCPGR